MATWRSHTDDGRHDVCGAGGRWSAQASIVALVLLAPALVGKWINHIHPDLLHPAMFSLRSLVFLGFVVARLLSFIVHAPQVDVKARSWPRTNQVIPDASTSRLRCARDVTAAGESSARTMCTENHCLIPTTRRYWRRTSTFPMGRFVTRSMSMDYSYKARCIRRDIVCTDCHDAHTARRRKEGNELCYSCHQAEKYGSREHHFHQMDSSGAQCVECHMPPRTYMAVDPRRYHSFRVPRPDLSKKLGMPNACNHCHTDKSPAWAVTYREVVRSAKVRKALWRDIPGRQPLHPRRR